MILRDSWPLTRESWDFVLAQKNAEKPDPPDCKYTAELTLFTPDSYISIFNLDTTESASRSEKSAGQGKGKKSKDGKESRSSKNQSGSRPASQQLNFDITKPHWTLRIVTDASFAVSVLFQISNPIQFHFGVLRGDLVFRIFITQSLIYTVPKMNHL